MGEGGWGRTEKENKERLKISKNARAIPNPSPMLDPTTICAILRKHFFLTVNEANVNPASNRFLYKNLELTILS